jgi:hypothetical protein
MVEFRGDFLRGVAGSTNVRPRLISPPAADAGASPVREPDEILGPEEKDTVFFPLAIAMIEQYLPLPVESLREFMGDDRFQYFCK